MDTITLNFILSALYIKLTYNRWVLDKKVNLDVNDSMVACT